MIHERRRDFDAVVFVHLEWRHVSRGRLVRRQEALDIGHVDVVRIDESSKVGFAVVTDAIIQVRGVGHEQMLGHIATARKWIFRADDRGFDRLLASRGKYRLHLSTATRVEDLQRTRRLVQPGEKSEEQEIGVVDRVVRMEMRQE